MNAAASSPILQQIRRMVAGEAIKNSPDQTLLRQFIERKDEGAFHVIVYRYGPMVLNVCRSILVHEADAEDAFQAAFLIFARKASSIQKAKSLGSWLHGVAYRTAQKALAERAKQRRHETSSAKSRSSTGEDPSWSEVQGVLHEELARLAERHRLPLILCFLQGKSQEQAALFLGLPRRTLQRRLEEARSRLRTRLARRGLGPAGVLLVAAWPSVALASSVPISLFTSTISAATALAAGGAATSGVSVRVVTLIEGVLKAMFLRKVKSLTVVLMATSILCLTVSLLTYNVLGQDESVAKQENTQAPVPKPKKSEDAEPTKPARIVFWRGARLAAIRVDDKDSVFHSKKLSGKEDLIPSTHHMRVSPDGNYVAWGMREVQQQANVYKVFVRKLDTEDDLGIDVGIEGFQWCWSPDGRKLLVGSRHWPDPKKEPEMSHWVVDVKTKEKTELKLPAGHMVTDWSPDGRCLLTMLAIQSTEAKGKGPRFESRICLVTVDKSETQILVRSEDLGEDRAVFFGRFSPDGRKALFLVLNTKEKPQTQQVYAIDLKEGKARQVSQELNAFVGGACWSPDSKQIAYTYQLSNVQPQPGAETENHLVITDLAGSIRTTVLTDKDGHRLGQLDWR